MKIALLLLCALVTAPYASAQTSSGKSVASGVAPAAAAGVRDIEALSPAERLNLPETTSVSVRGNVVTLRDVRAFHAERLKMAAEAAQNGMEIAAQILQQHPHAQEGKGRSARTLVPMPKSAFTSFAKDYRDFCVNAKATACIYLPVVSGYQKLFYFGPGVNGPLTMQVYDPLITEASVCKAGGGGFGGLGGEYGCTYQYPLEHTVQFVPTQKMSHFQHCPRNEEMKHFKGAVWKVEFDPHGAVYEKFLGNNGDYSRSVFRYTGSCVVQVYENHG